MCYQMESVGNKSLIIIVVFLIRPHSVDGREFVIWVLIITWELPYLQRISLYLFKITGYV